MPIAFRSITTLNYGSGHASPTVLAAPAGLANDDILIAVIDCGSTSGGTTVNDITPPAGFTAVAPAVEVTDIGIFVKHHVFWKRASGESGSYAFAHTGGAARSTGGALAAYSGALASGSPIAAFSTNSGTVDTATALSVTTTDADSMLVIAAHSFDAESTGTPAGFTNRFAHISVLHDGLQAVAGASGNKTFASGSHSAHPWQAWMLALKPPGTGGAGWVTKPVKVWTG